MYILFPRQYDKQAWRVYRREMAYFVWIYVNLAFASFGGMWSALPRRLDEGKVVAKDVWFVYTEAYEIGKLLVKHLISKKDN